jgi:molybdenum cofactor biosynthesis enzyme MoaA
MLKPTTSLLLRLNRTIPSNRLKFMGVLLADLLNIRHIIVRFDPVTTCNLRCQMCFFSNPEWREAEAGGRFTAEDIDILAREFFPRALSLSVGSAAEPTMHKGFIDVVRKGKEHGVPFVSVTSNGQLLTREHLRDLVRAGLDELTLSVHGVRAETYERMMRKASHARFLRLLEMVDEVRSEVRSRLFALRLNYTVNPDNLDELPDFFTVYGRFDIAAMQVRPMVDYGGTEYKHKSMLPHMPKYLAALKIIKEECKRRGIRLLYNEDDPTYSTNNELAPVFLEGVRRIVRPGLVWAKDYDWRNESYTTYVARSGFRRKMLDYVFGHTPIEPRHGRATATSAVL